MRQHPPQMDGAIRGISRHSEMVVRGRSVAVAALPCVCGGVCTHVWLHLCVSNSCECV